MGDAIICAIVMWVAYALCHGFYRLGYYQGEYDCTVRQIRAGVGPTGGDR